MHDQRSPRGSSPRNSSLATHSQDAGTQRALLAFVLAEHPTQLTTPEVVRELAQDPGDFAERDAVERAVRDLVGAGLLHRQGAFVLPTRAALHFDRLESEPGGGRH